MNFSDEFLRSTKSKGSWKLDFEASCEQFGVDSSNDHIVCDGSVCKISNLAVELKLWDALLVSFKYPESKLIEFSLCNVELNEQHINDLVLALTKISYLPVLKLEYVSFSPDRDLIKIYETLSTIFSNSVYIDYISLRGNRLGSEFFSVKLWDRLKSNLFLKAINLSGNSPSNEDISNLVNSIKFHPSLAYISLANCYCSTHTIEMFVTLKHGILVTTEEDAAWKKTAKLLIDKNKEFKEKNKLRKKLGLLLDNMIPEVPIPVINVENSNGHLHVCNNVLSIVDLSYNHDLTYSYDHLKELFVHIDSVSFPSSKNQHSLKDSGVILSPGTSRPNCASSALTTELKILLRGIIAENNEDCINGITFDYGTRKIIV